MGRQLKNELHGQHLVLPLHMVIPMKAFIKKEIANSYNINKYMYK
jgi:hypothetical protein